MFTNPLCGKGKSVRLLLLLGMLGTAAIAIKPYPVQADVELTAAQAAHALALPGLPVLNDNQIARLSDGTTSSVYAASDIHDYYAYEDTFKGQQRYDEAKASGQDPAKYLTWIAGDEKKRDKLVSDKKLILLPYNTRVRIVKYQKDKLEEWYFQQTGVSKRFGRYQVQVTEGPNKDLKVWTQNVVDLFPHAGDVAYLGILPDSKTPGGDALGTSPTVAFDQYALYNYWDAKMKGDDHTSDMYLNNNTVFSLDANTKCTIVKENKLPISDANYYQVQIMDGPSAGKTLWTLNVSMDKFPS